MYVGVGTYPKLRQISRNTLLGQGRGLEGQQCIKTITSYVRVGTYSCSKLMDMQEHFTGQGRGLEGQQCIKTASSYVGVGTYTYAELTDMQEHFTGQGRGLEGQQCI